MRMKTIIQIGCGILILLVMIPGANACSEKPPPEYADAITESMLLAMNEDDYAKLSEHFNEEMKETLSESVYRKNYNFMVIIIGEYVSKEFWKTEERGIYKTVYYKADFTEEPDDVIVKVVFQEIDGEIYVAGLWFDSPKLRE